MNNQCVCLSRNNFDDHGGLETGLENFGLGLEGCGLGLDLGLEGSGLVNIPVKYASIDGVGFSILSRWRPCRHFAQKSAVIW